MNGEYGFCRRLDLYRTAVARQVDCTPDRLSINRQANDGTTAEESVSGAEILTPVIVVEFLIVGDVDIRAIYTDRHVTGHLVCSTDQRQFVTAVEIAVILDVTVHRFGQVLDCIYTIGGNQCRWFTVGVRDVGQDNGATLCVAGIRPMRECRLHVTTEFCFTGTIRTPWTHLLF